MFEKRFKDLDSTVQAFEQRNKRLLLDQRDLEERVSCVGGAIDSPVDACSIIHMTLVLFCPPSHY